MTHVKAIRGPTAHEQAMIERLALQLLVSMLVTTHSMAGALADDHREAAFRGKRIAEANCGVCHALAQFDASTTEAAPPFREIGRDNSREVLRAMLRGAVFLEHAVMPDFEPTAQQAEDLATYIHSIASQK